MKMVWLGRTGVQVSQLCLGTMSFGGDADAREARRIYAASRDAGINFFDCADAYSGGRAEEILGGLIASERDQLVITSKCFLAVGSQADANARGANRRHILRAVERASSGLAPIGSTSCSCTVGMTERTWTRRCARSKTWCGAARWSTSA